MTNIAEKIVLPDNLSRDTLIDLLDQVRLQLSQMGTSGLKVGQKFIVGGKYADFYKGKPKYEHSSGHSRFVGTKMYIRDAEEDEWARHEDGTIIWGIVAYPEYQKNHKGKSHIHIPVEDVILIDEE